MRCQQAKIYAKLDLQKNTSLVKKTLLVFLLLPNFFNRKKNKKTTKRPK